MNMISSFTIDHTKLKTGIYVSRVDSVGKERVTTYDLRVCLPNKEHMTSKIAHTIEHLMADYLRNEWVYKQKVIYFGPMGCLTGFYLILKGKPDIVRVACALVDALRFCSNSLSIPGATEKECGNYKMNDLPGAIEYLKLFKEDIENKISQASEVFSYPL